MVGVLLNVFMGVDIYLIYYGGLFNLVTYLLICNKQINLASRWDLFVMDNFEKYCYGKLH